MTAGPLSAGKGHAALLAFALLAAAAGACGGEDVKPPGGLQPRPQDAGDTPPASATPATSATPSAATPGAAAPSAALPSAASVDAGADNASLPGAALPPLPVREFRERDFAETEGSRDPFRSFAGLFVAQARPPVTVQRKVLVDHYALDELKLVGLVTRTQPRALMTDPTGVGWVVKVGDFVGKAEIVRAGGPTGTDVAVNWRVDRIREGNVVFIREDPSHPEIPLTTRVIALRSPEEEAGQRVARPR